MVTEGNSLSVALFVDAAADRGFTYNINYVRISASSVNYTPTGGPASYLLDMDTGNMVFDGTIEDNFVGGATATEALQHIGNSARDQYAQITLSGVTDYNLTNAISDRGFTGLTRNEGLFTGSNWDLRDNDEPGSSSSIAFTFWGDFVNRWFWFNGDYQPEGTSGTVTITDHIAPTNRGIFEWSGITHLTNNRTAIFIRADDSTASSGDPPTAGQVTVTITDDGNPIAGKQILLHTNQTQDITQMFRICLLYTSPSPRDRQKSRMPSSA